MSKARAPSPPPPSPAPSSSRRPTFLAAYPRKLKLCATVLLLLPCVYGCTVAGISVWEKVSDSSLIFSLDAAGPAKETSIATAAATVTSAPVGAEPAPLAAEAPTTNASAVEAPPVLAEATDPLSLAMHENDTDDHDAHMASAPDSKLAENTQDGTLPRIGADGRKPWQVYARPFNSTDPRPRIALVITDLGLSNMATTSAIERLPASVTLAFDTQGSLTDTWLQRARQMGHETLLSVPMEPTDYPRSDPGARTLLSRLSDSTNLERLQHALKQGTGYIGIASFSGSRFVSDNDKLKIVLDVLRQRGLMIFDGTLASNSFVTDLAKERQLPSATALRKIDERATAADIDAALMQLEQSARLTGKAIAIAAPLPLTLDRLDLWIKTLAAHRIVLAPLSALVD